MVYCCVMFSSCSLLPLYVLVLLKYIICFYTICGLFILQWFIVSHGLLMCNVLILFFIASIFWYSLNIYICFYTRCGLFILQWKTVAIQNILFYGCLFSSRLWWNWPHEVALISSPISECNITVNHSYVSSTLMITQTSVVL